MIGIAQFSHEEFHYSTIIIILIIRIPHSFPPLPSTLLLLPPAFI